MTYKVQQSLRLTMIADSLDNTPHDVMKAFSYAFLNSIGSNGLSLRLLRQVLPMVMLIAAHIFNFSLNSGVSYSVEGVYDLSNKWDCSLRYICPTSR